MEIKMCRNVSMYIQTFCTLISKVPKMTQEENFSLFMHGLEPKTREQISYHMEGDLGNAMAMVEKADVWPNREREKKKDKTKQRAGNSGQLGQGQISKANKKPVWGK